MSVAAQNAAASTSSMSCRIHTIGKSWEIVRSCFALRLLAPVLRDVTQFVWRITRRQADLCEVT
jgi:hypothetical protein